MNRSMSRSMSRGAAPSETIASVPEGPRADDAVADILAHRGGLNEAIVDVDAATIKVVIFALGDALFAFAGSEVAEILPLCPIWFVPGCPPALEGVIDVRGEVCSVLRLGDLLGMPPPAEQAKVSNAEKGPRGAILLGRAGGMDSGLRVDAVVDVVDVIEADILAPPDTLPEALGCVARGVFEQASPTGPRSVLLLDLGRLFDAWRAGRP